MKFVPATAGEFVPASHEDARDPGVLKRILATHSDVQQGQVMMVNWARLPGASAFRRHYHEDMQEVFVILQGHVEMTVDDRRFELTVGDTMIVDVREPHDMRNLQDSLAEYLVFGVSSGAGGQTVVCDPNG